MQLSPCMWPFSSRNHDEYDDEQDDQLEEDHADPIPLQIIARWIAQHDGVQPNGAVIDRSFVVVEVKG